MYISTVLISCTSLWCALFHVHLYSVLHFMYIYGVLYFRLYSVMRMKKRKKMKRECVSVHFSFLFLLYFRLSLQDPARAAVCLWSLATEQVAVLFSRVILEEVQTLGTTCQREGAARRLRFLL